MVNGFQWVGGMGLGWSRSRGGDVGDPSTDRVDQRHAGERLAQGRAMPMTLDYAVALADARSCLAALADAATDFDESVHFEHLLLTLDALHPDGPAHYALAGDRGALLDRLDAAVDRMQALGGDPLSLELLAALAHETIRAN